MRVSENIKRYDIAKEQSAEVRVQLIRVLKAIRKGAASFDERTRLDSLKSEYEGELAILGCEMAEASADCIEELRRSAR